MVRRLSIEFFESKNPIREAVTKFGGQPVWITEPQWPLSKTTGNPMRFICQIALDPELFGEVQARMAYIFMTEEEQYVDGTWEPDGGENAVILQPGHTDLPIKVLSEGPTLQRKVERGKLFFRKHLVLQPCEFRVTATACDDPEFAPESIREEWTTEDWEQYMAALDGNKIGGTPIFLQNDEFPGPGSWRLLLELDSTRVPFYINFGDVGIGYAFLSENGEEAKFLWQCA